MPEFARCLIIMIVLSIGCQLASGESKNRDTTGVDPGSFLRKQAVPFSLIAGSVILQTGSIKEKIQGYFPHTDSRVDNYLRYAPLCQLYTCDLLGFRHRNSVADQSKYLALSLFTTGVIVEVLKNVSHVKRPSGGYTAFPSSHTTFAFTAATVVYQEFRDENRLLACSGFVTAGATGLLRVTNDAHWLPDVLAGAGLGILVTNLVYQVEPFRGWPSLALKKGISVLPVFTGDGLCLRINF